MLTEDHTRYPITPKVRAARAEFALHGKPAFVEKREATFEPRRLLFDILGPSLEAKGRCPLCKCRLSLEGLCSCLTVG